MSTRITNEAVNANTPLDAYAGAEASQLLARQLLELSAPVHSPDRFWHRAEEVFLSALISHTARAAEVAGRPATLAAVSDFVESNGPEEVLHALAETPSEHAARSLPLIRKCSTQVLASMHGHAKCVLRPPARRELPGPARAITAATHHLTLVFAGGFLIASLAVLVYAIYVNLSYTPPPPPPGSVDFFGRSQPPFSIHKALNILAYAMIASGLLMFVRTATARALRSPILLALFAACMYSSLGLLIFLANNAAASGCDPTPCPLAAASLTRPNGEATLTDEQPGSAYSARPQKGWWKENKAHEC